MITYFSSFSEILKVKRMGSRTPRLSKMAAFDLVSDICKYKQTEQKLSIPPPLRVINVPWLRLICNSMYLSQKHSTLDCKRITSNVKLGMSNLGCTGTAGFTGILEFFLDRCSRSCVSIFCVSSKQCSVCLVFVAVVVCLFSWKFFFDWNVFLTEMHERLSFGLPVEALWSNRMCYWHFDDREDKKELLFLTSFLSTRVKLLRYRFTMHTLMACVSLSFLLILTSRSSIAEPRLSDILRNSTQESILKEPTVLISIIARNSAHLLPNWLGYLENLDYPKKRISIW